MKSLVEKRSVIVGGHKTSISLEEAFWSALREIATQTDKPIADLVTEIDSTRTHGNLSSACRLHVLNYYIAKAKGSR